MPDLNLTRSMELYSEAARLMPGGSQTMSKRPAAFAYGAFPIFIERARGCHVWDVDGNRYLDFISALGPVTLGYAYPAVDRAVRAQLRRGTIMPLLHPLEVEAARSVVEAVPCAELVRFVKTGAEATAAAARIARAFTGREIVVTSGYHGWHDTWSALGGVQGVPEAMRGLAAGFAFGESSGERSLAAMLNQHRGRVACVMLEPVTYTRVDDSSFLRLARQLADEHGALLVFDEIVTGFRLALGGAQQHFGVVPDLACFAKGMANGLPIAAVAGRRDVMEATRDNIISTTYGGETLSLAAVVASIRECRERDVAAHLWRIGAALQSGLNEAARAAGLAFEVIGYPPMSAYRFLYDDAAENENLMTLLLEEMARRGILLRRGGLMFVSFSHGEREVERALRTARRVFPLLARAHEHGEVKQHIRSAPSQVAIRRV